MPWDQDISTAELQQAAASQPDRRQFIRAATVLKARLVTEGGTVEGTVLEPRDRHLIVDFLAE